MGRIVRASIIGIMILAMAPAAVAAPDRSALMQPGQSYTWNGNPGAGTNLRYWSLAAPLPGTSACTKDATAYCESILIEFYNPPSSGEFRDCLATVSIAATDPVSDYDIQIYQSDNNGTKGAPVASSWVAAYESTTEEVELNVRTTLAKPSTYFYVEIVYFAALGEYMGTINF